MHQCFKYCLDGVQKRIIADTRPFAVTESYFADSKFYDQHANTSEPKPQDATVAKGKETDADRTPTKVVDIRQPPSDLQQSAEERMAREWAEILRKEDAPRIKVNPFIPILNCISPSLY